MRDSMKYPFLSRSLPANNLLRRVLDVLILDREKIKGKYFKLRYARHFFRYTVPCILYAGSFFFEENVELFFKCSVFFFIVHNLIIKMFLAKEWFSFPCSLKFFTRYDFKYQCYYLFLIRK